MSSSRLVLEQEIAAPPDRVWDAITDHEGMSRWLDARVTVLARREGTNVGTVRRIRAHGVVVIDEEVVYADAPGEGRPGRLVYRIVRGAPLRFHRGEILVERVSDARSRLTWDIVVASDVPGAARIVVLGLDRVLRAGLSKLDGLLSA